MKHTALCAENVFEGRRILAAFQCNEYLWIGSRCLSFITQLGSPGSPRASSFGGGGTATRVPVRRGRRAIPVTNRPVPAPTSLRPPCPPLQSYVGSTYLDRSVRRRRLGIAETRGTKLARPTVLDPLVVSQVTSGRSLDRSGTWSYIIQNTLEHVFLSRVSRQETV